MRRYRLATILSGFALILTGATIAGSDTPPPQFGDPLPGLSKEQMEAFEEGSADFQEVETVEDGLGPVFNDVSCAACHSEPTVGGGGSARLETRFGRLTDGSFDPMVKSGGSLRQEQAIAGFMAEVEEPPGATIIAKRRTTPLFGLGLVDNVPDSTFEAIARLQARFTPATAGRPNRVMNLTTKEIVIGKFGWKAQVPTLFQFAGDAYLNEMGITNPQFPGENCPQGDCDALANNPAPGLNDDGVGVNNFTNFMTLLGPPPRGPITRDVAAGGVIFATLGCANCHVPVLQTGPHDVRALSNKTFFPFSDFLLHDMGSLGDGIVQGDATGEEMRTAPLWGLRKINRFLHDGRATTVEQAILEHDGQGAAARKLFNKLTSDAKAKLLEFLNSL
jgi:CxxC motif-containing protein (DUF1111 family)